MSVLSNVNEVLEAVKLIAETVTTVVAVGILIVHFIEKRPIKSLRRAIKIFFKTTVFTFIHGVKTANGKKIRGREAWKMEKDRRKNILDGITANEKTTNDSQDVYLLNKEKLEEVLFKSGIFTKVSQLSE